MYRKYFVYLDDGKRVYKVAVPAEDVESAIAYCTGNGEVIAAKDVTDSISRFSASISFFLKEKLWNRLRLKNRARKTGVLKSRELLRQGKQRKPKCR